MRDSSPSMFLLFRNYSPTRTREALEMRSGAEDPLGVVRAAAASLLKILFAAAAVTDELKTLVVPSAPRIWSVCRLP